MFGFKRKKHQPQDCDPQPSTTRSLLSSSLVKPLDQFDSLHGGDGIDPLPKWLSQSSDFYKQHQPSGVKNTRAPSGSNTI